MSENQPGHPDPGSLPYRPCVGIMLLNSSGMVWVGRRIPKWKKDAASRMWQMPQGGIDEGEQPGDAAFRELKEETGITKASLLAETEDWLTYDLPPEALGIALKGKYRGQRQKWLAMRFEGDDNEIDIASGKDGKPEFDAWKWAAISELPELIIPFKRKGDLQVADAFRHLAG